MTFWKTVRAYLTGWLIVQPLYNRAYSAWRRQEMAKPNGLYAQANRDQARAIVEFLHEFAPGEPPVALDVIMAQHAEIQRLREAEARLELRVVELEQQLRSAG